MILLSGLYLLAPSQERTVGLQQLIGFLPERVAQELATGFSMGYRRAAVAGLAGKLLLADLSGAPAGGKLLAERPP